MNSDSNGLHNAGALLLIELVNSVCQLVPVYHIIKHFTDPDKLPPQDTEANTGYYRANESYKRAAVIIYVP